MKFYEAIEPTKQSVLCCVNVEFVENDGSTSTTQFDVKLGMTEWSLMSAWMNFCVDNDIADDAIVGIEFVPGDGIFS